MPRLTAARQNPYSRKILHSRRSGLDHESLSCCRCCLMFPYKVAGVLIRQMRRMRRQYQVLILLAIGVVFLCLSRVLTGSSTDEFQQLEVPRHAQSQSHDKTVGEKVLYEKSTVCNNRRICRLGQVGFHLMTGFENSQKPYICLNNQIVLKDEDSGRGLNMVVMDGNIKEVVVSWHADTYSESPPSLINFLKKIAAKDVLIIVTADDAFRMLSKEVKDILSKDFNSQYINQLAYRSSWVFVGQKGIRTSAGIEKLNLIHGQWAERIELRGCLALPMNTNGSEIESRRDLSSNCNIPDCGNDKVSLHVVAGDAHGAVLQTPSVCVDGKKVMGPEKTKNYKPGSRGLNCIIFDTVQMKVVKIGRFDTYESVVDEGLFQKFLEGVEVGQIVIIATHDEASRKISFKTKALMKAFGSSRIEDLNFRDTWVFVGQRGIQGYTPYEKLGFRQGSKWGSKMEIKECIPTKIVGASVVSSIGNRKRQEFCKQYDNYPELCSDKNVNKTLRPLPLDDSTLTSNPAYNLPIVVVPGVELEPLQKCLSSLIAVPGLKPNNVLVVLNGNFPEPNELVRLYDFAIEYIKPQADYAAFLYDAISRALELFKGKENLIILEDYLEVTPDFLRYFSQTLHMLAKDPTLLTVSAWNPNGFVSTSGDETLVYRTDDFPGFGWIIRRSLWTDRMQKQKECCTLPTWRGWSLGDLMGGGSIIPDVSRVKRIKRQGGYYEDKPFMVRYLINRTSSSAGLLSEPTMVYKLDAKEYEKELLRLVTQSVPLKPTEFTKCLTGGKLSLKLETHAKKIYAVFYEQDSVDDHTLLLQLCKCFGLFVFEDTPLYNLHKGIVRFTHRGNHVILIGSKTVYFDNRPKSAEVLSNHGNTNDKG
ncbi:protein O-linked-mannose beta-1,2-N-acetylglucosaminyltransferase 1-like isoform X2 [Acanthaster planci]|uniref:Protein O-linked-mannose beta-1,2-N-acetylglucosaminyltransferase 1-like isoform X2 n=1 Tax=Acanthaster planci TaxID=133434 RepID=A0A8B7ZZ92_ACAPL|nr:protein O-linked-mannose beta-1,2-N-acetylglucosaminyltransferase 1-like isoform X2 [Acanthaster planci]